MFCYYYHIGDNARTKTFTDIELLREFVFRFENHFNKHETDLFLTAYCFLDRDVKKLKQVIKNNWCSFVTYSSHQDFLYLYNLKYNLVNGAFKVKDSSL